MIKPSEISDILKKQLDEVDSKINFEEVVLFSKWVMGWLMSMDSKMCGQANLSSLRMECTELR